MPQPELVWLKESVLITESEDVRIVNDGTELRLARVQPHHLGKYTCQASNVEGRIVHDTVLLIGGNTCINMLRIIQHCC